MSPLNRLVFLHVSRVDRDLQRPAHPALAAWRNGKLRFFLHTE